MKEKDKEKLPSSGKYIAVGVAVGTALGVALDNIGLGIALGLAIGAGIDWTIKNKNN
jgi:F0F1-type ATP synthase membrane subunit c/vacuolar-type H+-ATPase subunit K